MGARVYIEFLFECSTRREIRISVSLKCVVTAFLRARNPCVTLLFI